jgi:hypothetical protein
VSIIFVLVAAILGWLLRVSAVGEISGRMHWTLRAAGASVRPGRPSARP